MSRQAGLRALLGCTSSLQNFSFAPVAASSLSHSRNIGNWTPEHYGKPSPYTEGTKFLGTPSDHLERVSKRPISPDVLDIDGKSVHYKFPIQAISSITNRVTGVGLSVGLFGCGFIALTGDLPGTIHYLKACGPLVTFPLKGLVAFPIVYHLVAGIRHMMWDHGQIGNNASVDSMLELPEVKKSSEAVLYGSAAISALLALYWY